MEKHKVESGPNTANIQNNGEEKGSSLHESYSCM